MGIILSIVAAIIGGFMVGGNTNQAVVQTLPIGPTALKVSICPTLTEFTTSNQPSLTIANTRSFIQCEQQAKARGFTGVISWDVTTRACSLWPSMLYENRETQVIREIEIEINDSKLKVNTTHSPQTRNVCRIAGYEKPKFMDQWNPSQIKIGVTGQTGSGKSSLINSIRRIRNASDPEWSATGDLGETTLEPKCYEYNPGASLSLQICDLPGGGTPRFPAADYAKRMGLVYFDHILILTGDRWTETDALVYDVVKSFSHSVVRTKSRLLFQSPTKAQAKKEQAKLHYGKNLSERINFIDRDYDLDEQYDEHFNDEFREFLDDQALVDNVICKLISLNTLGHRKIWTQLYAWYKC
jgi:hypothetical protein